MDLQIQTRHIELDPSWRDLIERSAARLGRHYPELLRLHVTLVHGMHHRRGTETATMIAKVEGVTLLAEKEREDVRTALRAGFVALAVELERYHRERQHVTKSPGPRPQGSIKRIFRDGEYGFIHYRPGCDIYFNRRSLRDIEFASLKPGTPVEFEIEEGHEGLQASRVFPVGARSHA